MSTEWQVGRIEKRGLKDAVEKAVLVGVYSPSESRELAEEHLAELSFLAETAGAQSIEWFIQKLPHPNTSSYVGSGKLEEIKEYVKENGIDLLLIDDDISSKQQNHLEKELKIKVVDRSSLILDIFANRAQTAQAKTQVELAQIQYLLPRLRGMWSHLERQRGGIGMRGPGEKEIETDRRIVNDKISLLKKKLEKIDQQSLTQRKRRNTMARVSLVGYTNAGKSTLMNVISKSEVFAEDKLFATLDTTVRKVVFGRMPFLLSDTVGFIRKLPHHLIESFKSTLDEVKESDLLLHVVDISHPQYEDQIATVEKTLQELGADEIETIMVFNKMDLFRDKNFDDLLEKDTKEELESQLKSQIRNRYDKDCIFISAAKKEGLDDFRSYLKTKIEGLYEKRYPYMVKTF